MIAIPEVDCKRTGHFRACSLSFTRPSARITLLLACQISPCLAHLPLFCQLIKLKQFGALYLPLCKLIKFLPSMAPHKCISTLKINQGTLFHRFWLYSINKLNYPLQRVFGFTHKPIKLFHSLDQSNKEFRKTVSCTALLLIWFACCFLSVASILCGSSSGKVNKRGEGEWTANYVLASGKAIPTIIKYHYFHDP